MKTIILTTLFTLGLFAGSNWLNGQNIETSQIWATPDVLTTSESVLFYPAENILFVSCINGNPTDKDGNGFIAQVSLAGDVIMQKWATSLNAPKGMSIIGDKLYVTDIDRVVQIDLNSGATTREYPAEGAKFLNDISVDPDQNIYISDMAANKIYRIHNGAIGIWVDDEQIVNPNGMNYKDGEVLVGTKNGLYAIRIEDKRIWQIMKLEGGIDGLKLYGKDSYLVSDWVGHVRLINPIAEPLLILDLTKQKMNAADFEYIPEKDMIYIPTFGDNRVVAFEIIQK